MSASDLNTLLDRLGPIGSRVWDAARLQVAVGAIQDAFWIIYMIAGMLITVLIARRFWDRRETGAYNSGELTIEAVFSRVAAIAVVGFGSILVVWFIADLLVLLANPDYAAWRYIIGTIR